MALAADILECCTPWRTYGERFRERFAKAAACIEAIHRRVHGDGLADPGFG